MTADIVRTGIVSDTSGQVFGYAAWPSVCRLANGELLAVYSGNRLDHLCPFGKVLLRRSRDEGRNWSAPTVAVDTPLDDRDAGITVLPDGRLLLTTFNNTRAMQREWSDRWKPEGPMRSIIQSYCDLVTDEQEQKYFGSLASISEDGGYSWSEPFHVPVSAPHGVSVHKDRLLYPGTIAPDRPADSAYPIQIHESRDGRNWELLARIPRCEALAACGHYEPHLLSLGDRLLLTVRHDGEGIFTVSSAWSEDDGRSWTPLRPTGAAGSPPHLLLHSSGKVILTYGRRSKPYGIEAMVSTDRGEHWSEPVSLWENAPHPDLGYPCSVELSDGSIFTLYYGRSAENALCRICYTVWRV